MIQLSNYTTGEKVRTPRGTFNVIVISKAELERAGCYIHFTHGDYKILSDGTSAFAVKGE